MRFLHQKDADMTQGAITGQLIHFAIPMAIGLLFQQLYNTVDTVVVGQFVGKEALAAVGSTSSIINTLVGFSAGLSTGSSVVISQCYGAHNNRDLRSAVHTTVGITFIMSIVFTVLGFVLVEPLLRLMSTPEDVFAQARTYLRIYIAGLTGLLFYNMGSGVLRAVGDSTRPLYFLCFSAIVNTVFDLLFVIRFHLGVAGVAYATILAQALSAVLVMVVLTRDPGAYGVRWRELRIDRSMFGRIFAIGMPSGIQQAITAFSNVFVQSYINYFGSACMAGWSAYNKLDAFLNIPIQSIGMASTTFVGQNYGAGMMERARKGVTKAQMLSGSITVALSLVITLTAQEVIRLFTNDPEVMAFGVRFIQLNSPFYFALCFNQTYAGALRGIGSAKIPMVIMLFSFVLFRQAYLFTAKMLGNSLTAVAMAYPVGWAMCSVLLGVFFRRSVLCKKKTA